MDFFFLVTLEIKKNVKKLEGEGYFQLLKGNSKSTEGAYLHISVWGSLTWNILGMLDLYSAEERSQGGKVTAEAALRVIGGELPWCDPSPL